MNCNQAPLGGVSTNEAEMNLAELERKLIAAGRAHPPSERVPYAFEKRVMAYIAARSVPDVWAVWGRALWRAAAPCVAVTVLMCAWSYFAPGGNSPAGDLSQEIENTVLAVVDQDSSLDTTW